MSLHLASQDALRQMGAIGTFRSRLRLRSGLSLWRIAVPRLGAPITTGVKTSNDAVVEYSPVLAPSSARTRQGKEAQTDNSETCPTNLTHRREVVRKRSVYGDRSPATTTRNDNRSVGSPVWPSPVRWVCSAPVLRSVVCRRARVSLSSGPKGVSNQGGHSDAANR